MKEKLEKILKKHDEKVYEWCDTYRIADSGLPDDKYSTVASEILKLFGEYARLNEIK